MAHRFCLDFADRRNPQFLTGCFSILLCFTDKDSWKGGLPKSCCFTELSFRLGLPCVRNLLFPTHYCLCFFFIYMFLIFYSLFIIYMFPEHYWWIKMQFYSFFSKSYFYKYVLYSLYRLSNVLYHHLPDVSSISETRRKTQVVSILSRKSYFLLLTSSYRRRPNISH